MRTGFQPVSNGLRSVPEYPADLSPDPLRPFLALAGGDLWKFRWKLARPGFEPRPPGKQVDRSVAEQWEQLTIIGTLDFFVIIAPFGGFRKIRS